MGIFGHSWSPWGLQRFQPNAMILKLPILQSTDHKTTLDVFCFCAKSNRCAIACFLNISSHHVYCDDPSYHHDHGLHPQFKWQSQYQIGVTVGQRFIWWKMSSHPKWGPGMTKTAQISSLDFIIVINFIIVKLWLKVSCCLILMMSGDDDSDT